jgi:hypothetical protein
MRSRTRRFATLFVYAWTIYTVIQGGALLTNEPYVHTLQTAPRAVQGATGDGYAQTLIKVQRTLPYEEKVLVIWRHPESGELGFWYGYFWGTYWLYPRRVDFVTDAKAIPPGFGILLDVRAVGEADLSPPPGYSVIDVYSYPDQVVTILEAEHA